MAFCIYGIIRNMIMIRNFIILVAAFSALFGAAKSTDNQTFEKIYNLSPIEFRAKINYYSQNSYTDSAMLCANIQACKYGKKGLSAEEIYACCVSFHYMGIIYLQQYYNYQLAAENLLKAEQIAKEHDLTHLQVVILTDKSILTATRNDLETNYSYNKNVFEDFSNAFYFTYYQIKSVPSSRENNIDYLDISLSNLLYLAIKFDKTKEVTKEVHAFRNAQKDYGISCNVAEVLCKAIDFYNTSNYDKAFEALRAPIKCQESFSEQDQIQSQVAVKLAQYAVLLKCGKRAEALKLLFQQEQFLRENGMTFEQLEALQLIWQHYEVDGNKAMADKYALQYYITKDEFINKSKVGKVDQAKLNLELEQTRDRIQEMSYRQRMQTVVMWGSVVIALLAFALLGMLYMNYRKTKRTNRLLYEKNIALLAANQELMPATVAVPVKPDEKPANNEPTQADTDLMEKITAVMESSQEIFNDTFTINRLADMVGVHNRVVSRVINTCKGRNFNALMNEYRIKEACRRLMDAENYGSYTIEGIANSVGYKSRSNFITIFKSIIGLTPSAFQKMYRDGNTPTA